MSYLHNKLTIKFLYIKFLNVILCQIQYISARIVTHFDFALIESVFIYKKNALC